MWNDRNTSLPVASRGLLRLAAAAIVVLVLVAGCSSASPTPTSPPTPTPEPTPEPTATPTPESAATPTPPLVPAASEGGGTVVGEPATPDVDLTAITDPTDISQLPADVRELATCMKETLGEQRFDQVVTQIFARDFIPLSIDLPLIDACGVTLRQMQDLGALFGMGR